jgi:hypothetical protein
MTTGSDSPRAAFSWDNPSRYMTITYMISLSVIALLSIVVHANVLRFEEAASNALAQPSANPGQIYFPLTGLPGFRTVYAIKSENTLANARKSPRCLVQLA